MKNTKTFKMESNVPEQFLIENCLNLYHSGFEYKHLLAFHALAHGWKYDKLIYYVKLIEGVKK
jgi:hypothetical protein